VLLGDLIAFPAGLKNSKGGEAGSMNCLFCFFCLLRKQQNAMIASKMSATPPTTEPTIIGTVFDDFVTEEATADAVDA
jgi:hypothetical protein